MAAIHRRSWPDATKHERQIHLEMRHAQMQPDWFHVLNVPKSLSKEELEAWRAINPDWEFRLVLE